MYCIVKRGNMRNISRVRTFDPFVLTTTELYDAWVTTQKNKIESSIKEVKEELSSQWKNCMEEYTILTGEKRLSELKVRALHSDGKLGYGTTITLLNKTEENFIYRNIPASYVLIRNTSGTLVDEFSVRTYKDLLEYYPFNIITAETFNALAAVFGCGVAVDAFFPGELVIDPRLTGLL